MLHVTVLLRPPIHRIWSVTFMSQRNFYVFSNANELEKWLKRRKGIYLSSVLL